MTKKINNYLEVVYDEKTRPLTGYPNLLTKYLFKRFNLRKDNLFWILAAVERIYKQFY